MLDTHLLLWAAANTSRLSPETLSILTDEANDLIFSAASIWEIAIKSAKNLPGFSFNPIVLRTELEDRDYRELPINSRHGAAVSILPALHRDPFDRILIAQAIVEDITLLTVDTQMARYPGPVRLV